MEAPLKLEDTNMAAYGSEAHRKAAYEAALTEEAFKNAGQTPGLEIWRVEQFKLKRWPRERYGEFHTGDSYIVLNTYETESGNLAYDAHFWLGKETTIDEMGTAAYMTVVLDDLLRDVPVQHREVEGFESELFLSYFPEPPVILEGGVDSGFNHVEEEKFPTRMLWVKGKGRRIRVLQVPCKAKSMNRGDSFLVDTGNLIYIWFGSGSGVFEKNKARETAMKLIASRPKGGKTVAVDDGDEPEEFWELIGGKKEIQDSEGSDSKVKMLKKRLFRLSDESGDLEFEKVRKGLLEPTDLTSDDVYILDNGTDIFIWVGRGASSQEKSLAMIHALKYLDKKKRPAETPITRIIEGAESKLFWDAFAQEA